MKTSPNPARFIEPSVNACELSDSYKLRDSEQNFNEMREYYDTLGKLEEIIDQLMNGTQNLIDEDKIGLMKKIDELIEHISFRLNTTVDLLSRDWKYYDCCKMLFITLRNIVNKMKNIDALKEEIFPVLSEMKVEASRHRFNCFVSLCEYELGDLGESS